jgi:serine/threonine protein phosphatase PrpC
MVYCSECGKDNRDEARFCSDCGRLIDSPSQSPPPPLAEEYIAESSVYINQNSTAQLQEQTQVDTQSLPLTTEEDPPILETGTLLHGRYSIRRLLSRCEPGTSEDVIYVAEDRLRCWSCLSLQADPDPLFCENCGAELTQDSSSAKSLVNLRVIPLPPTELPADWFTEQGVTYQVEVPAIPVENRSHRLQMFAGYQSDIGKQRDLDEDSLGVLLLTGLAAMRNSPMLGFFAVADGIGGYEAGEVASRTAIQVILTSVMEKIYLPIVRCGPGSPQAQEFKFGIEILFKEIVLEANQAILNLHKTRVIQTGDESITVRNDNLVNLSPGSDMGCTLTAALVFDDAAWIANVGDSRTYLLRKGSLTRLTVDHSIVAKLVQQGLISNEQAYIHDQRNVIYRSLGDKTDLEVDISSITLEPGDRLVLCCDGLWEMVHDPYIEDVLVERFDPQSACDRLVELANQAGGEDNISVIVVNIVPV